MTLQIVSQQDLEVFQSLHFSPACVEYFSHNFLGPEEYEDLEDDKLGYYEDGTKRTLTEEQIAIFRHSEIQSLIREQNRFGDKKTDFQNFQLASDPENKDSTERVVSDVSKCFEEANIHQKPLNKKARKALKAKLKGYYRPIVKPDLRKRTWDKVEVGLENLNYDEVQGQSNLEASQPAQRRKISYDE